jgi:hypothetical protein
MLLIISADDYKEHYINFTTAVKNNILEDSLFCRLIYSTENFTTTGLYLRNYSKEKLTQIEQDLLVAYNSSKTKLFSLNEHAANNSLLKISGIWESSTSVGLAYKFSHLF